jgi:hypothetical protein
MWSKLDWTRIKRLNRERDGGIILKDAQRATWENGWEGLGIVPISLNRFEKGKWADESIKISSFSQIVERAISHIFIKIESSSAANAVAFYSIMLW